LAEAQEYFLSTSARYRSYATAFSFRENEKRFFDVVVAVSPLCDGIIVYNKEQRICHKTG